MVNQKVKEPAPRLKVAGPASPIRNGLVDLTLPAEAHTAQTDSHAGIWAACHRQVSKRSGDGQQITPDVNGERFDGLWETPPPNPPFPFAAWVNPRSVQPCTSSTELQLVAS